MNKISNIKGIFFDFGGCLDSSGIHSRKIFEYFFYQNDLFLSISKGSFQDAYTYADQKINNEGLASNVNLLEMNKIMSYHIMDHQKIVATDHDFFTIVKNITNFQSNCLQKNLPIIKTLSMDYQLGIISNFSGNLEIILKDFSYHSYFDFIIDSYHFGHTKPNKKIFQESLLLSKLAANNVLYVGDNPERDIRPAKSLGLNTAYFFNKKEKSRDEAKTSVISDHYISDLSELLVYSKKGSQ